jgi:hypothetical protein
MNRLHFSKEYHCKKIGAKRPSGWSDTPFWPISLKEEEKKRVPKRWKTNFHQIYSLKPGMIWYYKGSVAILFWDEKGL